MQGFSGGEILKGIYLLIWRKVRCYECGGIGHKRSDHREKMKKVEKREKKSELEKEEDRKDIMIKKEMKKKNKKKKEKSDKKKIEKIDVAIETEREIVKGEKRDMEIATEEEIMVEKIDEKRETELRE